MNQYKHYAVIANLFEYPDALYLERVSSVQTRIRETHGEAMGALDDFITLLPKDDLRLLQELFTRSFDVQAVTTLDIGYVMFGDDYKRGELLSNLNREHVAHQVDCGHELADHLPNVLKLMSKLEDEELLLELVNEIVAPALHTMVGEFDDSRIEKKHKAYRKHYKTLIEAPSKSAAIATVYKHSLQALYQVLKKDFNVVERIQVANGSDFLASLSTENEIEDKAHAFY